MKIATCLTVDGEVGTPFEAGSVCVFERHDRTWVPVREFGYFPVSDMGINHARLLLKGIATQLTDCEIFLVSALQGFTHVWLEELGFRTWKSEGPLMEQLDNVAEQDEKTMLAKRQTGQSLCESQSAGGGCDTGCSTGCGGSCGSGDGDGGTFGAADFGAAHPIPPPVSVGDETDGRFRIDLAAILELDPFLNSRQVILPILEEKNFSVLEIHFDHLPKWFHQTIDQLGLCAEIEDCLPPARGLEALVTVKE